MDNGGKYIYLSGPGYYPGRYLGREDGDPDLGKWKLIYLFEGIL